MKKKWNGKLGNFACVYNLYLFEEREKKVRESVHIIKGYRNGEIMLFTLPLSAALLFVFPISLNR